MCSSFLHMAYFLYNFTTTSTNFPLYVFIIYSIENRDNLWSFSDKKYVNLRWESRIFFLSFLHDKNSNEPSKLYLILTLLLVHIPQRLAVIAKII